MQLKKMMQEAVFWRLCQTCGKVFSVDAARYHNFIPNDHHFPMKCGICSGRDRLPMACLFCGKEFTGRKRRYCSQECQYKANEQAKHDTRVIRGPVERACERCGQVFTPTHGGMKYCSKECKQQPRQVGKCELCGNEFIKPRKSAKYCTACTSIAAKKKQRERARKSRAKPRTWHGIAAHHRGTAAESLFDAFAACNGWSVFYPKQDANAAIDRIVLIDNQPMRVQVKAVNVQEKGDSIRVSKTDRIYGIDAFDFLACVNIETMQVAMVHWPAIYPKCSVMWSHLTPLWINESLTPTTGGVVALVT